MTRRRWLADEVSGNRAALVGDQAAHLSRVLRARVGQEFDIAADGRVRRGRIIAVSPERVEFELGQEIGAAPVAELRLLLAIFKFDRMEWAIEKAAEIGVAGIIPVKAARSESHLCAAAEKRVERWRRIAREAAQQARRVSPPEIAEPVQLRKAIETHRGIVLAEAEAEMSLTEALGHVNPPATLAVGPEGGWSVSELDAFQQAGWTLASLGPNILRAETAAIVALGITAERLRNKAADQP
jgi:16S rRNA (uracil1498-N3)-methyltransferase